LHLPAEQIGNHGGSAAIRHVDKVDTGHHLEQFTEDMLPVRFPPDFQTELHHTVAHFPATMKASMANDLEAGNRLELDWLAGKVVALGRKYGIPTPAQEAVYAILKPYRMGRVQ
jgi:ketopantoate reductase